MKRILAILATCIIFLLLFISLKHKAEKVTYHTDEISWFFHTRFFDELFIKRNINKTLWESYESFDHPQLSKYIFGVYLYTKDKEVFQKRDALEQQHGRWRFYSEIDNFEIEKNFSNYIYHMRQLNVVFTFFTIMLLFITLWYLSKSWLLSVLFSFAFVNNDLFINSMIRATSDAHVTLFILISLLLYLIYLKRNNKFYLVLFALFSGLAISSKLTGLVTLIAFTIFEIVNLLINKAKNTNFLSRVGLVFGIAFIVWWIINPALYQNPLENSTRYITFRLQQSRVLQDFLPKVTLLGLGAKFRAVFCTLFSPRCGEIYKKGHLFTFLSLNLATFLFGGYCLVKKLKKWKDREFLFFFIFLVVMIIITGGYLPLNWDRYFLPLMIGVYFIQFIGIIDLIKIAKGFMLNTILPRLSFYL